MWELCFAEQKCSTGPRELKKNTTGTSVRETTCTIHRKTHLFTINKYQRRHHVNKSVKVKKVLVLCKCQEIGVVEQKYSTGPRELKKNTTGTSIPLRDRLHNPQQNQPVHNKHSKYQRRHYINRMSAQYLSQLLYPVISTLAWCRSCYRMVSILLYQLYNDYADYDDDDEAGVRGVGIQPHTRS